MTRMVLTMTRLEESFRIRNNLLHLSYPPLGTECPLLYFNITNLRSELQERRCEKPVRPASRSIDRRGQRRYFRT